MSEDFPWWLWVLFAALLPLLVVYKLLSVLFEEARKLRYPRAELRRVGAIVQVWRARHLWLVLDPRRDRILRTTLLDDYTMASGWEGGDTLVVAEIRGRRVRFRVADDTILRWLETT